MTYISIILTAAKMAKVSGALLVAICTQETRLTNVTVYHDGGSPSYGICQMKYQTAKMLGFQGKADDLINPIVNAHWAAKYVAYQAERYGNDWCKIAAAYNAGSFNESKILPGHPRNLKYVRYVQKHIDKKYKHKLSCSTEGLAWQQNR